MKQRVIQAIKERRLVRLRYGNRKHLTVAPLALGETMTGYSALFCWHTGAGQGEETKWRLLDFDRIAEVQVLNQHFAPLPNNRGLPGNEFLMLEAVL